VKLVLAYGISIMANTEPIFQLGAKSMRPATLPDGQRDNFAHVLQMDIQREQEDERIGPDEAFLRTALSTLGFDPDEGYYTDGPYDCGIDYIHVTQEEASIFQAKSLAITDGIPLHALLDASYLDPIRRTLEVLQNLDALPPEANKPVTEALSSLRNEINRRALILAAEGYDAGADDTIVLAAERTKEIPEYKVSIYFLGLARGFTLQAESEFDRLAVCKQIIYGRVHLDISIIPVFIDDLLAEKWQQRNVDWKDRQGRKREEVTLTIAGQAIIDAKSAVFFTRAHDLVEAFEAYGYQIFEPNVRCELKESKVNQAIKKTVTTREGRREFRHLNNGITVVCTGWTSKQKNGRVDSLIVRRPGVVNGLQTVKSLHDAFRRLPQEDQIDFKEHCLVLCRLHQEGSVSRLDQLVKATNNQNPMKPRNLRSNDPEQTAYESLFANLGWFYERKQGAWDAFKADPRGWRGLHGKKADFFHISAKKYRVVDNDELAQNWLAFIGYSTEAINDKRTIFDQDNFYTLIFLRRAKRHGYDYDFRLTQDSSVYKEAASGSPDPAAMLVPWLCREAADALAISRRENREKSIIRLGLKDRGRDDQDRALDGDPEYQINKISRGMLTLFVEFVGFVLFRALGDNFHTDSGKLLKNGCFQALANQLNPTEMIRRYQSQEFHRDDLLPILFAAFDHCVRQLYESNWLRSYNDASVKNKFIYSIRTRKQLLEELIELDRRFTRGEWVRSWADGFNAAHGVFSHVRRVLIEAR
jgi:AIPR protein